LTKSIFWYIILIGFRESIFETKNLKKGEEVKTLKVVLVILVVILSLTVSNVLMADNTNFTMNIVQTNFNGIACVAVTASYPTNSFGRSLQWSTDLTYSNSWGGLQLSEYISKANSPTNDWSTWYIPTTNSNTKLRYYRMTGFIP